MDPPLAATVRWNVAATRMISQKNRGSCGVPTRLAGVSALEWRVWARILCRAEAEISWKFDRPLGEGPAVFPTRGVPSNVRLQPQPRRLPRGRSEARCRDRLSRADPAASGVPSGGQFGD